MKPPAEWSRYGYRALLVVSSVTAFVFAASRLFRPTVDVDPERLDTRSKHVPASVQLRAIERKLPSESRRPQLAQAIPRRHVSRSEAARANFPKEILAQWDAEIGSLLLGSEVLADGKRLFEMAGVLPSSRSLAAWHLELLQPASRGAQLGPGLRTERAAISSYVTRSGVRVWLELLEETGQPIALRMSFLVPPRT